MQKRLSDRSLTRFKNGLSAVFASMAVTAHTRRQLLIFYQAKSALK
jgi:hypothetical protein